jgi:hypothetical protein
VGRIPLRHAAAPAAGGQAVAILIAWRVGGLRGSDDRVVAEG